MGPVEMTSIIFASITFSVHVLYELGYYFQCTGCFIISVRIRTYYICYVRLSMVINHIDLSFLRPMTYF